MRRADDRDRDGAPLDLELLAEFVAAVEDGVAPSQAALEEAAYSVERRRELQRYVLRARALRLFAEARRAEPMARLEDVARRVARRVDVPWETVRRWWRERPPDVGAPALT